MQPRTAGDGQTPLHGSVSVMQFRTVKRDSAARLAEVKPLQAFLKAAGVTLIIIKNVELVIEGAVRVGCALRAPAALCIALAAHPTQLTAR